MKRWVARAVCMGLAMARFLGTSSPKIIVRNVPSARPIAVATGRTAPSGTPADSSGPRIRCETAGSARKPMARLVTVIPTWAPESCVDSERSALCTPWAAWSPACGVPVDLGAVDGDERELGRDEDPTGRDQQQREGQEQQVGHGGASLGPTPPRGLLRRC